MDWTSKFRYLQQGRTTRHIEQTAGLAEGVLTATLSRKSMPNVGNAVKIARALGVTTEWLFDDDKDVDDLALASAPDPTTVKVMRAIATSLIESASRIEQEITQSNLSEEQRKYVDDAVEESVEGGKASASSEKQAG